MIVNVACSSYLTATIVQVVRRPLNCQLRGSVWFEDSYNNRSRSYTKFGYSWCKHTEELADLTPRKPLSSLPFHHCTPYSSLSLQWIRFSTCYASYFVTVNFVPMYVPEFVNWKKIFSRLSRVTLISNSLGIVVDKMQRTIRLLLQYNQGKAVSICLSVIQSSSHIEELWKNYA